MKAGVQSILDAIENGNIEDYLPLFNNDYKMLLRFLEKHNVIDRIDPFGDDFSDYQHEILDFQLNELNDKKTWDYVISQLSNDLEKIGDDYYFVTSDMSELSDLFYDGGRNVSPHDVAKSVLSEDWWEPYYDTTDDIYNDVIENLNEENLNYLKGVIVKNLEGTSVVAVEDDFAKTDLLGELSKEQQSDNVKIDISNIDRVINDEGTMKYLLNEYLNDLDGDLYSLYNSSYNNAYSSEVYNDVWDELSEYFDEKSKEWVPYKNYKGETNYNFRIKLRPGTLYNVISDYVKEERYDPIGYVGGFFEILRNLMKDGDYEILYFRIPDYPNYSDVIKDLNDNFGNYF